MNERQARAEGLEFTGCWVRNYERVEARESAKYIREKYKCRAVVVNEQGGVAVYADKKYFELQRLNDLECRLKLIPCQRQRLLEQLAELEADEKKLSEQIAEIENKYGIVERS